jgi:hypothetical protein
LEYKAWRFPSYQKHTSNSLLKLLAWNRCRLLARK